MPANAVKELQNAPLPALIEKLGLAIANAQFALDKNAISIAQLLTDADHGVDLNDSFGKRTLLELGFQPTFYQITEATVEARVAFTASESEEFSIGASIGVNLGYFAASVNASYAAKYSFTGSGSSAITARFVAVPPPSVFSDILRSTIRTRPPTP